MRDQAIGREDAEAIAISALRFIAADTELLPRFLAITGIEASSIRRAASEPGFLAGCCSSSSLTNRRCCSLQEPQACLLTP